MAEQFGEGKVKLGVQDDTAPGLNSAENKVTGAVARMKASANEGIGAVQKGVSATVGVLSGLVGAVTAVVGVMTLFYNIGKKAGEAIFGVAEAAEDAGSRIEDHLSASIKRASVNASKLGITLGMIGLEEDRKRIEKFDEEINKLNEDIKEVTTTRGGLVGVAAYVGKLEAARQKIIDDRNRLVRRIGETDRRLQRQFDTAAAAEEEAKQKKASDRAAETAEEKADNEIVQIQRIDKARDEAHDAQMDRIRTENAARLRGVQDLIAAEERLRGIQAEQVAGFERSRGGRDIRGIAETLERIDRKINYTTPARRI